MSDGSILLELDGSAQARYAAEIAWMIGKASNMRVDALHVVDSLAAWDFLAFDISGFIGSGPYFEAHEKMRECLSSIGKNLIDVYSKLAKQNGVTGETFLDEGSTIREICARAKNYDVVVMGHQGSGMNSPGEDKRKLPRRSVVETLTYYVNRPLLVVQDRCPLWTKARILIGENQVSASNIRSCLAFLESIGAEPSVQLVLTKDLDKAGAGATAKKGTKKSATDTKVVADLKKSIPELEDVEINVEWAESVDLHLNNTTEHEPDVLLVMPTMRVEMPAFMPQVDVRTTSISVPPDYVVRYSNHPAILFWIEEVEAKKQTKASKSVSTAV